MKITVKYEQGYGVDELVEDSMRLKTRTHVGQDGEIVEYVYERHLIWIPF